MPQVKEMIIREYGKPPITKNIDVDTIVAAGAAMQAQLCKENVLVIGGPAARSSARIGGAPVGNTGGLVIRAADIQDITAHSLGMLAVSKNDENEYVNSIIIEKNSKMNQEFGKKYQLSGDKLDVYVLQGESKSPYEATLLYNYEISGMPKGQKNAFTVNFLYNNNGVVEVNARLDNGTLLKAQKRDITESITEIIARLTKEREEAKKNAIRDIEVMFMLDTSYSMEGNPMRQAKNAMHDFVSNLNLANTKVAILDFADKSRWACNFTNDAYTLKRTIDSLDVDGPCGICNAETPLRNRGNDFRNSQAAKIIVVLTDGIWQDQNTEIRAAQNLKDKGIQIYAVGFGGADEGFLRQIASEKGARKIDLSKLSSTFKEIASSIATEMS